MADQIIPASLTGLLSASETVLGLLLSGRLSPTQFDPDKFHSTYGRVVRDIKEGMSREDLYLKYSNILQPAEFAAKSVVEIADSLDWVDVMDKAYSSEVISSELFRAQKYLGMGDYPKFDDIMRRIMATRNTVQRMRSVSADEIEDEYVPFIKSGTPVWDEHIGGLPNIGVTILAAKWGDGKTTAAIDLMDNFLREYPEKEVLFVTLEDMSEGWKERAGIVLGSRAQDFWHRVKVMEFANDVNEIIQEASRYENLGLIVLDYVDYLVKEESLSGYKAVYRALGMGSKSLAVDSKFQSMPIIAIAQFGRGAYQGGVPTPSALMYTGEQFAYQLVMLYDPNTDFHADNEKNPYVLPQAPGRAYLVVWKVKNGNRKHPEAPNGAIQVMISKRGGLVLDGDSNWLSLMGDTKRAVPTGNRR